MQVQVCVLRIPSTALTSRFARQPARPVMIVDHVPAVRVPLIMRLATWLRLSRREETWKTEEILILRHQLTVLQRRQPRRPRLNWAVSFPPNRGGIGYKE